MRFGLAALVIVAACSTATPAATTSTSSTTTTLDPAAVFVANLSETLSGTSYSEVVLEDPEPFLTTGLLMCELLAEGTSPRDVIMQFLNSFGPDPGEADSALAGALLGSAVNAFCPEHRDALVDDLG